MWYTIGHSNYSIEDFLYRLEQCGEAKVLVDIRSFPGSRMFPQYQQLRLKSVLEKHGWQYMYLGQLLGPRNHDEKAPLNRGNVQYQEVLARERYQEGVKALKAIGTGGVLMAAKADPIECHRFIVLSRVMIAHGMHVQHFDGSVVCTHNELQDKMIQKCLNRVKRRTLQPYPPMSTHDEVVEWAYHAVAEKAAKAGLKKYAEIRKRTR
ncbi:DUF488 family protein [Photobacterium kagoshimensis]|uniref:DUF488 domain-containing protein n=1 Tax=Photobacterium kagoshimensis TaxID=2910242 RepID=UPI003D0E5466